jgi:Tol biopolymer transport system component
MPRLALAAVVLGVAAVAASCGDERTGPTAGRFLVYTRNLNGPEPAVWIARVDGTHRRRLVRNAVYGALSPDGRWVAFGRCLASRDRCQTGNAPFALFLVATSGGKPRLLARAATYPSWSPTSDRIVAQRRNELVRLDLDGRLRVLDEKPGTLGWSFSPDGKSVVYARSRPHTRCASDLFVVAADGGEERVLTRGRDIFPVWGRHWVAFSRFPKSCAYARSIWRVRPDGSDVRPVTGPLPPRLARSGYYGFDPIAWAAGDRALLAGIRSEWGPEAIRVDAATGAFRRLGGYALDLSRDGRFALVDTARVEGPQTVWAVPIAGGPRRVLVHGDVGAASWNR